MKKTEVIKSACGFCGSCCGILITLEDGKPVAVNGDPDVAPNRGGLCRVGRAALDYLSSPDRLKKPLKRVGDRGGGRWEEVSWEEALRYAARGLNRIKEEYGPQAVAVIHGSAKSVIDTLAVRFANAFGTPNVVCSDHVCHIPRMLAAEYTFGYFPAPDLHSKPGSIIAWGMNRAQTGIFRHKEFVEARAKGSRLIAIDPFKTPYAQSADLWLRLRPGTDLALALGLLNVVLSEGLYDADFVKRHTIGFDKLCSHVERYTPQSVAQFTWVPANLISEAARLYATSGPSCIGWGNGLDQGPDSFQTNRAIASLMAVTGNLDVPGGEYEGLSSGFRWCDQESDRGRIRGRWSATMELRNRLTPEQRYIKVAPDLLPDFRYVTPNSFVRAVLEGNPYPIRGAFVQASNPLSSWNDVKRTHDAFKKVDFLVVSDMFMTPTAALADVVFPVASFLESDAVRMGPGGSVAYLQTKLAQVGESQSDYEIISGLAKEAGLGEYFWEDPEDLWDYMLDPAGITFKEFRKKGIFHNSTPRHYRKYEKNGFFTPTGKVELYSTLLESLGFDPLPTYREPVSPDDPRVITEAYDLSCTCRKVMPYHHSGGRQIHRLRKTHPDPIVMIHPDTAHERNINQGDWVYIESRTGKIRQRARLSSDLDRRVIVAEHGWWFPERGHEEFYGFAESNYNALIGNQGPQNPEVGSFPVRGLACRVYKAS
ncbi:MAG TPA: molybdopterin-dependent oxidoreductase [Syntrophorhabdaceae bacterium]|nr:molybdopterin-dependent oxidoreductase [Syntrophorhabdaceae bacterium]